MGELAIRRNRGFSAVRQQAVERTEKSAAQSRSVTKTPGFTVSETLRQLMSRIGQAENHARESRRTLQTGEGMLAEVRESLERIAGLAQRSAGGEEPDRAALQEELEQLREGIERMIGSAVVGDTQLFLDEEAGLADGAETLLAAVMEELSAKQEAALPNWLMEGIAQKVPDVEQLLLALGLDRSATGSELLAAVTGNTGDPAVRYLAALYLGAVIAGGASGGWADPSSALEGLQKLLDQVAEGVSPDQAIHRLSGGAFSSFSDFQDQFTAGTAPELQAFLVDLLLSGGGLPFQTDVSLLDLLTGLEGANLELMMRLLAAVQAMETVPAAAPAAAAAPRTAALQFGDMQVTGRDLSGVAFDAAAGKLTVSGGADVLIQGTGAETISVAGSGTVTLQDVRASVLAVDTPEGRIFSVGETVLGEVRLEQRGVVTFGGGGLVRIGALRLGFSGILRAGEPAALHLTGGAVVLGEGTAPLALPVILDGPASLAAQAERVSSSGGKILEPFDLVWKTLLPGWSGITAVAVDGRQARMALFSGEPARLWLEKGDRGCPVHTLLIRGRDALGQPRTRYAYLHWNQQMGIFQEVSMYPNPFTVTGGEPGRDWLYEEESHTLCILSNQVNAVAGGRGTDVSQNSFSGRIALADGIGAMELALDGVACRVSSGRAFDLGRGNDVTLHLSSGSGNLFESGAGCAGISLGSGTALCIDSPDRHGGGNPAGTLAATGGAGGAGIGRDSDQGKDRSSRILIRGGVIESTGTGGGAGIGAGKHSPMGAITILGGTVTASAETGGGAGIGGALGAAVGSIGIHGGRVSAIASYHAAAIGAGIQGACGDILITGTARVIRAVGGDPGADIGACLFGACGNVQISGGADIGRAKLRTRAGVPLQMGEDTVTLPQFRLSVRSLQLDRLDVSRRESAQAAGSVIDADLRWIAQIQAAYAALYDRLEQSFGGLRNVQQYLGAAKALVRDAGAAGSLLEDTRRSIPLADSQAMHTHGKKSMEGVRQLLQ